MNKHGKGTSTELTSTTYTRHVSAARHGCSIADVANHGTSILITVIRYDAIQPYLPAATFSLIPSEITLLLSTCL